MRIDYALVDTLLDWLLVAVTERGVCSVMLGDSEDQLLKELNQRFPQGDFRQDQERLKPQVKALVAYLEGLPSSLDFPLDETGTAFQLRVWQELRCIPKGGQISYSELADRIGRPRAVRAVASACARNPVAIITPCHRVVRLNGDLGGYRWGLERKRRLLEAEQA
jgi:AraC family transcriptional regulator of adaptative response/methylated-DNA-[protein]-cysteine methyltransferase